MRSPARLRALVLNLAVLAGVLLVAAPMASAAKYDLGVGDSHLYPAAQSAPLRAVASRVVIDPAKPLSSYDAHIAAHRAVGQLPQLVIGGTGTKNHRSTKGVVATALAAAKRWAPVYSVSVVNEPDTAGVSVCGYAKAYVSAYGKLRAAGVKRVLFGEFAPHNATRWLRATLTRCGSTSKQLRTKVGNVAWHAYGTGVDLAVPVSKLTRQLTHRRPKLYVTEAGYVLRHRSGTVLAAGVSGDAVAWWRHALKVASAHLTEIVAWDIRARPNAVWDSSLIDAAGRPRPAFGVIAGR
ncbi:MAG TPA: hypothetical protein VGC59_06045 [Solirubrobacteraceae bacterium]